MGYLLAGHLVLSEPELAGLQRLPEHVGYRLFRSRAAPLWVVETFRADKPPKWPLTTLPAAHGDVAGFASAAPLYAAACQLLDSRRRPRPADHFTGGWDLSRLLQTTILTFAADDELLDGAATFAAGRVARLREQDMMRGFDVTVADDGLTVQPYDVEGMPTAEEEDRAARLKELMMLPGAGVNPPTGEAPGKLFHIVVAEVKAFAPPAVELLGLGTWEPGMKAGAFEQVAERVHPSAPRFPPPPPVEPFAYPVTFESAADGQTDVLAVVGDGRIIVESDESVIKLRFLSTEQPITVRDALGSHLKLCEHCDRGAAPVPALEMAMNSHLRILGDAAPLRAKIELLTNVWVAVRFTGLLRQRAFDLLMRLCRRGRRR